MGGAIKSIVSGIGDALKSAVGGIVQMAMSAFTGSGGIGGIFGQLLSAVGGGAAQSMIGGLAQNFMGQASSMLSQTGLGAMGQAFKQATNSSDVLSTVGSFTDSLRNQNTSPAGITQLAGDNLANASAATYA